MQFHNISEDFREDANKIGSLRHGLQDEESATGSCLKDGESANRAAANAGINWRRALQRLYLASRRRTASEAREVAVAAYQPAWPLSNGT
jgi:hypothetical protein